MGKHFTHNQRARGDRNIQLRFAHFPRVLPWHSVSPFNHYFSINNSQRRGVLTLSTSSLPVVIHPIIKKPRQQRPGEECHRHQLQQEIGQVAFDFRRPKKGGQSTFPFQQLDTPLPFSAFLAADFVTCLPNISKMTTNGHTQLNSSCHVLSEFLVRRANWKFHFP